MKICRRCKKTLSVGQFGKNKRSKDGLRSECRDCKKIESNRWNKKNKKYNKEYRAANKEKLKQKNSEYYYKNREAILETKKKYIEKNRDTLAKKYRRWYEANKKRIIQEKSIRYREDLDFRLAYKLRNRLNIAARGGYKSGSAVRDLGCSIVELKAHLESQFTDGMSWENYGRWHIDHIIPLASFDLSDREQLKCACHYTNLQPLWAEDNLRKGCKVPKIRSKECQID